jgi:cobalamin biosynthesis protein CobT
MAGRIKLAADTALVFCEALSRLDIPCNVLGFSTRRWTCYSRDTEARTGMTFGQLVNSYRIAPLRHTYFKHFHESFRAVSGRFDAMLPQDVTPLGESILFAARELAMRREERKVLFVLTDGQPEVGLGDDSATFRHAKDSIKRVERADIDVALVGILTNCVTDLHHRAVVVNSLAELPKTVMRQLQSLLTDNHHSTN